MTDAGLDAPHDSQSQRVKRRALVVCLQLKQVPTEEGRNAELALYRRKPDEAEAILIQVRARV